MTDFIALIDTGSVQLIYNDYDGNNTVLEELQEGEFFGSITYNVNSDEITCITKEETQITFIEYNEITNDELVLSATCQRLNASGTVEGTCESISQAPISDMTIAKKINIEAGITHKYTFTILFKETNADQNTNQGKKFNGVLGIEEYKAPNFATDSWSTIIANVKSGNISDYNVGDTKTVDMGKYGTHTLRVANTSTPSECSTTGLSQSPCVDLLEFADIITTYIMCDTNTNAGGWPSTSMRTFVNNDIYNALSDEIKNAIIDTTVVSGFGPDDIVTGKQLQLMGNHYMIQQKI